MTDITRATVASDEDASLGFVLADEHAPKTRDERLAWLCFTAAVEWDILLDPRKVHGGDEAKPYVSDGDEECLRPAEDGEEVDSRWFVFTDLDEAIR